MFKPAKILHTKTFLPKGTVSDVILKLHEKGVSELKETEADLPAGFDYIDLKDIDETERKVSHLLELLNDYKEITQVGNFLLEMIFPPEPEKFKVDLLSDEEIISEANRFINVVEPHVLGLTAEAEQLNEKIEANTLLKKNLELLPSIETIVCESTENFRVFSGLMTKEGIDTALPFLEKNTVFGVQEKEKNFLVIVFCLKEHEMTVERELHEAGFAEIDFPKSEDKPQKLIFNLTDENNSMNRRLLEIEKEMKNIWRKYNEKFTILEEELQIARQRIEAANLFKAGDSFAVLEAWVPQEQFEEFRQAIESITKNYYMETKERDDAPTLLKNPGIIAPFEMITELYGLPKYNAWDPTPMLALTFPFFYGFMLGDLAYGIFMAVLCYFIVIGIGKHSAGMKRFGKAFLIIGIVTAVMGIVFKSYFGNFFPELGNFLGISIEMPGFIDAMKDILVLIILSLLIGAVHLLSGLVFGLLENLSKKNWLAAAKDQGVWLIFFLGVVATIIPATQMIGLGMLVFAVILQVVTNFLDSGPAVALLSPMNFAGFVGDLFSYARLAAMAVGTAGIALAVNFMVFLAIKLIPVVGILVGIIIFIVGHLFNFGMNALGSFIHTLRLHFLEYFSKFYQGGGKKYQPFFAYRKRNYTEVE